MLNNKFTPFHNNRKKREREKNDFCYGVQVVLKLNFDYEPEQLKAGHGRLSSLTLHQRARHAGYDLCAHNLITGVKHIS